MIYRKICSHCHKENHSKTPIKVCQYCGRVLETTPIGTRTTAGAVGGALVGFAIGGAGGAFLGLIIGSIMGASADENEKKKLERGYY